MVLRAIHGNEGAAIELEGKEEAARVASGDRRRE